MKRGEFAPCSAYKGVSVHEVTLEMHVLATALDQITVRLQSRNVKKPLLVYASVIIKLDLIKLNISYTCTLLSTQRPTTNTLLQRTRRLPHLRNVSTPILDDLNLFRNNKRAPHVTQCSELVQTNISIFKAIRPVTYKTV